MRNTALHRNMWGTSQKSQRFVLKTSNRFPAHVPRGAHEFPREHRALSEHDRDLLASVVDLHDIDYVIARVSSKSSPGCPRGWVSSDDCRKLENSLLSPPPPPSATSLRNVKAKLVSSEVQNGREREREGGWKSSANFLPPCLEFLRFFIAFSMQSPASEMQWRSNRRAGDLFMVAVGCYRIVVLIRLLYWIDFYG